MKEADAMTSEELAHKLAQMQKMLEEQRIDRHKANGQMAQTMLTVSNQSLQQAADVNDLKKQFEEIRATTSETRDGVRRLEVCMMGDMGRKGLIGDMALLEARVVKVETDHEHSVQRLDTKIAWVGGVVAGISALLGLLATLNSVFHFVGGS